MPFDDGCDDIVESDDVDRVSVGLPNNRTPARVLGVAGRPEVEGTGWQVGTPHGLIRNDRAVAELCEIAPGSGKVRRDRFKQVNAGRASLECLMRKESGVTADVEHDGPGWQLLRQPVLVSRDDSVEDRVVIGSVTQLERHGLENSSARQRFPRSSRPTTRGIPCLTRRLAPSLISATTCELPGEDWRNGPALRQLRC